MAAEKIKLNKNTLREQNQALKLYLEFLPTLELRKQQLQLEVREARKRIENRQQALRQSLEDAKESAPMLARTVDEARALVVVDEVLVTAGNVAGVKVPVFDEVRFKPVTYSLVGTPPFLDAALFFWRGVLAARAEIDILGRQLALLDEQLTKTTQRINLYEKVLIPQTRENIRKIKVYLGDQQTAAVCRAKIAKRKLERLAEAEAQQAEG